MDPLRTPSWMTASLNAAFSAPLACADILTGSPWGNKPCELETHEQDLERGGELCNCWTKARQRPQAKTNLAPLSLEAFPQDVSHSRSLHL